MWFPPLIHSNLSRLVYRYSQGICLYLEGAGIDKGGMVVYGWIASRIAHVAITLRD